MARSFYEAWEIEQGNKVSTTCCGVDVKKIKSEVLLRLVEEVRNNEPSTVRAFDRIHNRHNRS